MGRPRQHKETARLGVSFSKADDARVTATAEANEVSTAWIIRKAVGTYLDAFGQSLSRVGIHRRPQKGNPLPARKGQRR